MKRIILLLCILIGTFGVTVHATSYHFEWDETTTYIDVPLGSNINQYTSIPKAYLYVDKVKKEDAVISYLTTGDWLYLLTDVDTSKVGEYKVWYKATESKYSPGQCEGYKTLVTFNVIDIEAPVILDLVREINYFISADKPDYLKSIVVSDNSGNYNINIDDSNVLYDKVGSYTVNVRIDDGYNVTSDIIIVNVLDPVGPIIKFLGENNTIRLNTNQPINIKELFQATDTIDGDVTHTISYEPFDTSIEKEFDLVVTFNDKSGNKDSITVHIVIVDENVPVINLVSDTLILEYNSDYEEAIRQNIKEAYVGNIDIKDSVKINLSNIKNSVGSYTVIYSYTYKEKQTLKSITVNILSSNLPTLVLENFESAIGVKPDYFSHIKVIDESDPYIMSKIEIDDSLVDYYTEGRYGVTVTVVNSSGLTKTDTLYVNIVKETNSLVSGSIEENKEYVIGGIVIVVLAVIIIIWYNKKRNNKIRNS